MSTRRGDLDHFYGLLGELERHSGGKRRLADCHGRMGWPPRGVYYFFEDGEFREDGVSPRVVRVGTHALRPAKSTLWGRLSQHKGIAGGSMPGGGNHRGSIFRLHVGTALMASGTWPDCVAKSWGAGRTAATAVRRAEYPLERAVTERIAAMPFLWLAISDPPGPMSDRGVIEAGAIAMLSNIDKPALDPPSRRWLGRYARERLIRDSGLWNVHHVRAQEGNHFLDVLARWIDTQSCVRRETQ